MRPWCGECKGDGCNRFVHGIVRSKRTVKLSYVKSAWDEVRGKTLWEDMRGEKHLFLMEWKREGPVYASRTCMGWSFDVEAKKHVDGSAWRQHKEQNMRMKGINLPSASEDTNRNHKWPPPHKLPRRLQARLCPWMLWEEGGMVENLTRSLNDDWPLVVTSLLPLCIAFEAIWREGV